MKLKKPFMFIIAGPTGVGKTDLALTIASQIPAEIINCDIGQFYKPLTIGTAKPDWQREQATHHLFDILNEPRNFTVAEYRQLLVDTIENVLARKKLPIIVGGSLFYIKSLLFPPRAGATEEKKIDYQAGNLWDLLKSIDPKRAAMINKNDFYRIKRALAIWFEFGIKPSEYLPAFDPPADFLLLYVTRDRKELYQRINERVNHMIERGWIEEVAELQRTSWEPFLLKKKIIGYPDILAYLSGSQTTENKQQLITTIAQKTRNYAKRQATFWSMLKRSVLANGKKRVSHTADVQEVNLTSTDLNLYIKQLLSRLTLLFDK